MRVSTFQFYNLNTNNLTNLQSQNNRTLQQLSSGKQINTAADDPVANIAIENLKQQSAMLSQYEANINLANNRLRQEEPHLASYENLLMNARDIMLAGNDGSLSLENRRVHASDLKANLDSLLSLANSQDESGNYLFAGTDSDTKPFVEQAGVVTYVGNSGQRTAMVGDGVSVPVNDPGNEVFMNVPVASGAYQADYANATMSEKFFIESAEVVNPALTQAPSYQFDFVNDGAGNVAYEVYDDGGTLVSGPTAFDPTQPIAFQGVEVTLSGDPQIGDSLTMAQQESRDVFTVMNRAISMLESHEGLTGPNAQAEYAQLLGDLGEVFNHATGVRAEVGNRMKALETYENQHSDMKLVSESVKSTLEDLDYAAAISEFERQSLAMNALTETFGKMSGTSLFDFV
ncbi:flagellar hook-associated protein FlgL [Ferrimonas sp. SCSIO 43195]|uniref:flagellar hook-associated protein FlgL n=1 Tax=Ferrimonas sp. SCSIO 43195 TaxID=2822844 RepID=UPI0020759A89|nr:flagellar hook-associated protein FlgL [Ferrimonas sp. SCSIO 43195]USD38616.1 flagellar hook-associated protein FlgL [Ferrimonas sp. SCSIO 43195]